MQGPIKFGESDLKAAENGKYEILLRKFNNRNAKDVLHLAIFYLRDAMVTSRH